MENPSEGGVSVVLRPISVEQARSIRDAVLRPNLPPGGSIYPGDDVADTRHLGAYVGASLVAVATVCREAAPDHPIPGAWRLRGMATVPQWQGRGIGRELAEACIEYARHQGASMVWCSARQEGAAFYLGLGFTPVGEAFRLPQYSDRSYVRMERRRQHVAG